MKVSAYNTKDILLNTVEDMVSALLEMPKGYTLNPLGQQCAISVDHYNKCVYLDNPDWIDEQKNIIREQIVEDDASWEFDVNEKTLEPYTLYYMWESTSETDGVYTYYSSEKAARDAFDSCENKQKTYGTACFNESILEPSDVLGSTL